MMKNKIILYILFQYILLNIITNKNILLLFIDFLFIQFSSSLSKIKQEKQNKEQNKTSDIIDNVIGEENITDTATQLLKLASGSIYTQDTEKFYSDSQKLHQKIQEQTNIKQTNNGFKQPQFWDLDADLELLQQFRALNVATVTKILPGNPFKATVNIRQQATFLVGKHMKLNAKDLEEGMRVGLNGKFDIQLPLPASIDSTVQLMLVQDQVDQTYSDMGGVKKQIDLVKEIIEYPLKYPERFSSIGVEPPRSCIFYGLPGTGKTMLARAVAGSTNCSFIKITGSELNQKYVGEGARIVREIFQMARSKQKCIIFFDEADSFAQTRTEEAMQTGDSGVQRTLIEVLNQLDGFKQNKGNVYVIFATNRLNSLDPALLRPGRIDRKIEFGLPDLDGIEEILQIKLKNISCEEIRTKFIARLLTGASPAEIDAVVRFSGVIAMRDNRRRVTENDLIQSVERIMKEWKKFEIRDKYWSDNK